jgi:hypothetical protein
MAHNATGHSAEAAADDYYTDRSRSRKPIVMDLDVSDITNTSGVGIQKLSSAPD